MYRRRFDALSSNTTYYFRIQTHNIAVASAIVEANFTTSAGNIINLELYSEC